MKQNQKRLKRKKKKKEKVTPLKNEKEGERVEQVFHISDL